MDSSSSSCAGLAQDAAIATAVAAALDQIGNHEFSKDTCDLLENTQSQEC